MALARNTSRAQQRQVDLTTAVCQERLLATHVRHVLALVDLTAEKLPFDAALDIYVRILRLTPEQARNVGSRALASLGARSGLPRAEELDLEPIGEMEEEEEEEAPPADGGRFDAVFSRVRRRIRGRVQEELRNRINLAAARADDDIFLTHVENSLVFAKAMDDMEMPDAVELYLETMLLPDGVSDVIFNRALRTVADQLLPPVAPRHRPGQAEEARKTEVPVT